MEYVVHPSALTHISQSANFFDALTSCGIIEETPAYELFGFRSNDNGAFDPKKIDLRDIDSASIQVVQKSVEALERSLSDWEHRLSKEMNDCVSKMFGANKDRVKLFNKDMKRYQEQAKDADRRMKEAGSNAQVRANIEAEKQDALDHFEQVRETIRNMSSALLISPELYSAVNESLTLVREGLNLVKTEFKSYEKTVDAKFKETDIRYCIDDDAYIREMNMHRTTLTDPFSDVAKRLNEISNAATKINENRIFGQKVVVNLANCIHFDLSNTRSITATYQEYRKITDKIHKRLSILRQDCRNLSAGKPAVNSALMISQEIVFLTAFCLKFSDMMLLYMRPQLGMIEAASQANY